MMYRRVKMMELKIKRLDKGLPLPAYAKDSDAGLDLYAAKDQTLLPLERAVIPSGIAVEIPGGYFGNVRPRSGLAVKQGLHTMAGVVDAGYRAEIGVVLVNLGQEPILITRGMRIAQLLILPVIHATVIEAEELSSSERGEAGFGSTGHR